jgi:oxygen-dependent protoporphyrinogen oxidase
MQTLVDSISARVAASASVVYERVTSIEPGADVWRVMFAGQHLEATHVVLALPTYVASELVGNSVPELASELSQVPYSSAVLVTVIYHRKDASIPEGFGFLVPRRERRTIAATTFIGAKWPPRIPPDLVALRAFVVDPEAPQLLTVSDEELVEAVRADFKRLLEISADPMFSTVHRWPNSMPQYVVGHQARQARIAEILSRMPGLHLTGNAYDGVGVPDCVRLAKTTAEKIASHSN